VRHLHILNVPHPGVMDRAVRLQPRQMRKSWYVFMFQLPWLPEWAARRHDWQALVRAVQGSSRPGSFSAEDLNAYRAAWSQPDAFRSMLNWYRAIVRASLWRPTPRRRVTPPTHIIWGRQDIALDFSLTAPSLALCDRGRLTVFDDASHWVHLDAAAAVTDLILADLAAATGVQ
jgi:pimeloyl-ACP methyl ester carboxylesterase